jgi:hypothetical protein
MKKNKNIIKLIITLQMLFLSGCNQAPNKTSFAYFALGSNNPVQTWIYLCGLINNFDPQNMNEVKTLDMIGKELNLKILAIIPQDRCSEYNNNLCWPHQNKDELLQTYEKIINTINTKIIDGYIGFSNGGFFLLQLAQYKVLNQPIIAIGAAGKINNIDGPDNTINLLIGKDDEWHYEHALNFYNQSKNTNLHINLIEYEDGHEIPVNTLRDILKELI